METFVTDKELGRNAARRLAIIRHAAEVTGNVAKTCRVRDLQAGLLHLAAPLPGRASRGCWTGHETPSEVVAKIIYLRTTHHFSLAKIAMHLQRYHDIEISN